MVVRASAPLLIPEGVEFRSPSRCRVIRRTDTETTVVFGIPLESPVPAARELPSVQSRVRNLDCGTSRPRTISPEQQSQPSLNLQFEPESNGGLGTAATKNAAVNGSVGDPVFTGIKAEKDTDLGAGLRPLRDSQSLGECQSSPPAAGGDMSDTYIGALAFRLLMRDYCPIIGYKKQASFSSKLVPRNKRRGHPPLYSLRDVSINQMTMRIGYASRSVGRQAPKGDRAIRSELFLCGMTRTTIISSYAPFRSLQ
jgi:hypothetical protein